jgi:general secretion pathway protein K
MKLLRRQGGAAVIVAMLIVAMAAAAAASLLQQQDLALRQLTTSRDYEQAAWILKGGAQWARSLLQADARGSKIDHAGELWGSGLPTTEIEQGTVAGQISDQQGLFNVNNLARDGIASARDIAASAPLQVIGLMPASLRPPRTGSTQTASGCRRPAQRTRTTCGCPCPRAANQLIAEIGEPPRARRRRACSRSFAGLPPLPRRTP